MIRSIVGSNGTFNKLFEIPITGYRSIYETTFTVPAGTNTDAVELAFSWGQYIGEFYVFSLEISHKE